MIFGNVSKADILLEKELEQLSLKRPDQFEVYHVLNNPPDDSWTQGVGYISKQIVEERLPKPGNDVKILVCGPPPLVKAVTTVSKISRYG